MKTCVYKSTIFVSLMTTAQLTSLLLEIGRTSDILVGVTTKAMLGLLRFGGDFIIHIVRN